MFAAVRRIVLLTSVVMLCAASVRADPIVVTSGDTFFYWDGEFTSAVLRGNGFQVITDGLGFAFPNVVDSGPSAFTGGLSFVAPSPRTFDVIVNGTPYEAYLEGSMRMEGVPFVIPPPSGPQPVTFSAPFTMTGQLRGTTADRGGSVLFDVSLAGAGTASATLFGRTDGLYSTAGVNYVFEAPDPPSPTPEPATLLLMGTGLAAIVAKARRRGTTAALPR
jgi:hypothetical protein